MPTFPNDPNEPKPYTGPILSNPALEPKSIPVDPELPIEPTNGDGWDFIKAEVVEKPIKAAVEADAVPEAPKKDLLGRDRVIGLKNANQATGVNPKDRIGATKVDFTLCPSTAYTAWALAQMDGANKYGAYNWRIEPIQLRTYIGAIQRHALDFLEDEHVALDSLIEHMGHIMSSAAIIIDAMRAGTFVDDRPVKGVGSSVIAEANKFIEETKPKGWSR